MDQRYYYVYIMASWHGTLYTGVTNNLMRRIVEHKEGAIAGFTRKYRATHLVYYETITRIHDAIAREKQIKGYRRSKKVALIESINPGWEDLSEKKRGVPQDGPDTEPMEGDGKNGNNNDHNHD